MMIRTYRELQNIKTFSGRYEYLRLSGIVGEKTFGYDRVLNQLLYTSPRWRKTRSNIIIRDNGCDLGIDGYEIIDKILIHHLNPVSIEDIELDRDEVYDPEFLISTSLNTHNAIHYGDERLLPQLPIERRRNDTCPWR
jgi:hypothetical protein